MYETYFSLADRPFASVPRADWYFPGKTIEVARNTLVRCIDRTEGVGIVVGPSGTGKTLLVQALAEQFRESLNVVLLSSGRLSTRRALFQVILFGLGQPYRGMDEGELRLAMVDYLTFREERPQGMLLLVDEAHTLPLRLLDEIRMITNLVADSQPRTRLVLAGNSALEERFASPKLESFSQRIVARCYLEPFGRDETEEYVRHQLEMAGQTSEVFSCEACTAVSQATNGIPRLINQLCDHCLLLACAAGQKHVGREVVEEAWADLQQLPSPWNDCDGASEGGIIEFGGLLDEPEEIQHLSVDSVNDGDPSIPALRITPEPDESIPDVVRQMEGIEQSLAEIDEGFQPAGSIGPELELVFPDPENPFNEQFDDEEVVEDDYRPSRVDNRGEDLQVWGTSRCEEGFDETDGDRLDTTETAASVASGQATDDAPEEPEIDESMVSRELAEDSPRDASFELAPEPETVPMRRDEPATEADWETAPPSDPDMIVVEESYDMGFRRPIPTVRRREYGQLFAKLRRSC